MEDRGRLQEIDIAKGMACLLMIAAHFISGKTLPFGTFAAPLFFACSGMNTILLIEKTRDNRRYDLFHLLFPLLLFFGGGTQIVIAHGGRWRIFPEFLQCIAMSVLLLFVLGRLFAHPRRCGILFPVPFLVQMLLPQAVQDSFRHTPLAFVFGNSFTLFPWLGFFLFGIFLLWLKRRSLFWLLAALSSAFVLSFAVSGVPLRKFDMSNSYVLLALIAATAAFLLARWVAGRSVQAFFKGLAEFFALPGRNALMFVYLHYFVLRFFATVPLAPSAGLHMILEALYLFSACWVFLLLYERVKSDTALFFPVLALALALAGLRWGGLMKLRVDLLVVDMVIGVLFAFLYVQARRRFAARCDPTAAGRPS